MADEYIHKSFDGGAEPTTLTSGFTINGPTLAVANGTSFPDGSSGPFVVVIDRGLASEEKFLVDTTSGVNNITFNIQQAGYDGTSFSNHSVGAIVEHCLDAYTIEQANRYVNLQSTKGSLVTYTGIAPVSHLASVTNNHVLLTDSTTTNGIKWGQIIESSIADDAITAAKIATNAVGSSELADNAVDTASIVNLAVTGAKIANSTVSAGKLDTLYCQSGTGSGQSGNVVKIGWSPASNLRVQVDATDFGATWPINITGSASSATTATTATTATSATTAGSVTGQTSNNTANAVVQRDSGGSFSANNVVLGNYSTTNGNGILRVGINSTSYTPITTNQVNGGYHLSFYRDGSNIGSISDNGANTLFNNTSDYRLKENINPLTNALTLINKLTPKTFNFIQSPTIVCNGFIAHELQEHVPAIVTGKKDALNEDGSIKPQQIDVSQLVPFLVSAIQELSARIVELESK